MFASTSVTSKENQNIICLTSLSQSHPQNKDCCLTCLSKITWITRLSPKCSKQLSGFWLQIHTLASC